MAYGELVEHLENKIKKCMCPLECGQEILTEKIVTDHYEKCKNRIVACEHCSLTMKPDNLHSHLTSDC